MQARKLCHGSDRAGIDQIRHPECRWKSDVIRPVVCECPQDQMRIHVFQGNLFGHDFYAGHLHEGLNNGGNVVFRTFGNENAGPYQAARCKRFCAFSRIDAQVLQAGRPGGKGCDGVSAQRHCAGDGLAAGCQRRWFACQCQSETPWGECIYNSAR